MSRAGTSLVGTTFGLEQRDMGNERSEQVYVRVIEDEKVRPILIEGWVGYAIPSKLQLTKRQAAELAGLLAQALAVT